MPTPVCNYQLSRIYDGRLKAYKYTYTCKHACACTTAATCMFVSRDTCTDCRSVHVRRYLFLQKNDLSALPNGLFDKLPLLT